MSFSSKKRRKAKKNPVEEESGFGQHVRFDTSNAKLLGKRLQCSISELHTCHEKIEKKEAKLRNDSHYRSKTLPELRVKRGGLIKDIPKTHEELGNILKCVPDELQTEPKQRNFASLGHATNRTKQRTHLTDLTREHGHDTSDMLSCTDCWRKDQQIIHLQDQLQRHERNENRRKCPQCDIKEAEVSSLQDQEKYLQRQIDDMKEKANARIKQLEDQIRATSSQIDGLQQSFQKERREKEDALTRLSSLASSKLRDNNPNITDLSDQNRPTKIAEKMSELYDNEWTEAFDSLEQSMDETDIIKSLFGVLKEVFKTCKTLAWNDFFKKIQADMYPHIKVYLFCLFYL
ncbi:uncharacterized protein LOC128227500 [Mya arenaria]|uniref:uncharacterized protein LOC128227500 n=1 Tax=Mya arenaria TaxID=6604 RepID=UPI0022E39516|nr:uncharacterized protein LOC128227500 [Mya arenaria]